MTHRLGNRVARIFLMATLLAGAVSGCQRPTVTDMGTPVTAGGVQFEMTGYDLRYLELDDDDRTVEYARPVLAVHVKMTNQKAKALNYSPSHRTQQMTEATTPLLYRDPGKEAELPPASKKTVKGVYLEQGKLDDQVRQSQTLAKGDSVEDTFLFEVPGQKKSALILSLPPTMHHGTMPVLIRLPYTYKKPTAPTVYKTGQTVKVGAAGFRVDSAKAAYIKTKHTIEGDGYSAKPRLKVSYTVKNTGKKPLMYTPDHDVEGARGATLFAGEETYKRVKLPSNAQAVGQVDQDTEIGPGKSVSDFVIFERPPKAVKSLRLVYPANHFGSTGLIRVKLPYTRTEPALPKEMQKEAKKDESSDDDEP